jgi:hypothetical protein
VSGKRSFKRLHGSEGGVDGCGADSIGVGELPCGFERAGECAERSRTLRVRRRFARAEFRFDETEQPGRERLESGRGRDMWVCFRAA